MPDDEGFLRNRELIVNVAREQHVEFVVIHVRSSK
jgi:hypothetical protein